MAYRRFSPVVLRRFVKEGRGTGVGEHYIPWHQVRPADPVSRGRSHLVNGQFNRLHHFLSDGEHAVFGLACMLPLVDAREQYPLSLLAHSPELGQYRALGDGRLTLGTLAIASDLGIRHPVVAGRGETAPWVMTTDLLLTLASDDGRRSLLAVAVKPTSQLTRARTLELLRIEREYWFRQDVTWLLITPEMIGLETARTIRGCLQWVLQSNDEDVVPLFREAAAAGWPEAIHGHSLDVALAGLSAILGPDRGTCQRVFWRAVWNGLLPIDLSVPLRPASKLRLLDAQAFQAQNPVAMRRTAWLS